MNMRSVFNFFKNLTERIDSTPFSSVGDSTDVPVEDASGIVKAISVKGALLIWAFSYQ